MTERERGSSSLAPTRSGATNLSVEPGWSRRVKRLAKLFPAALCALALTPSAYGQGCALCYTTAAAAGAAARHSLNLGIFVLLVPTLVLFISILAFAVRRAATIH